MERTEYVPARTAKGKVLRCSEVLGHIGPITEKQKQ